MGWDSLAVIVDTLHNIGIYKAISMELAEAICFVESVEEDVPLGTYRVSKNVSAIVSEYMTKQDDEGRWEAHRKMIDIQYPLKGKEKVIWAPLPVMKENSEYNSAKDVTYYSSPGRGVELILGAKTFAIFFTGDAHKPSLAVDGRQEYVKKLTMKVRVL